MASVGPPRLDHQSQVSPVSSRSPSHLYSAKSLDIERTCRRPRRCAYSQEMGKMDNRNWRRIQNWPRLYWTSWPNHVVFSISASNQKGANTCTLTDQQQNDGKLPRAKTSTCNSKEPILCMPTIQPDSASVLKVGPMFASTHCSRTSKKAWITFDSLTKTHLADSSHTCRISALKKYEQAFSTTTYILTFSIHKFDNDITVSRASICIKLYAKSRLSTNLGSVALLGCQKDWPLRFRYFDIAGWGGTKLWQSVNQHIRH